MRSSATAVACLVTLALLAFAPAAFGDAYDRVFADYQKDGRIDACKHSEDELRSAKQQVPNDIEQYAPDFPAALDDALEKRARGECDKPATQTTDTTAQAAPAATTPPANPTGGAAPANEATPASPATGAPATTPAPPGTANAATTAQDGAIADTAKRTANDTGGDAPAPLLLLAIVGGLLAIALAVWGLMRWLAYEPHWGPGARHALQEAGWHAGGAWENFADWLRRGRPAR